MLILIPSLRNAYSLLSVFIQDMSPIVLGAEKIHHERLTQRYSTHQYEDTQMLIS